LSQSRPPGIWRETHELCDRNGDVAAASLLELDRRSRPAVISRTVVLSRRSDLADSRTAISQPSGRH
jgi:hypothetical protein